MFEVFKEEYVHRTFRLTKKLAEELAEHAAQNYVSVNKLVEQCCQYALDHHRDKVKKINE